tara:strand:+ start:2642 stop:2803 length:162 start_codon:yes stop_codon:yes gene_type:complete
MMILSLNSCADKLPLKKVGRLQNSYTSRVQLKNKKAAWLNSFTVASNKGGVLW